MDTSVRRRSLRIVVLLAAAYFLIGITFAEFSDWAAANAMRLMWRRLAWLVSGAGFAAHIAYGHLLSISEITSGLNSRPSQSWTVMVEAMNPELPPVDTRS